MKKFVFTCGDINGIGPEIVIKSLNYLIRNKKQYGFYLISPSNVFNKAAKLIKPQFDFIITSEYRETEPGTVIILNTGAVKIEKGRATEHSGRCAYEAIEISFALLKKKLADAVITAPVSKTALKIAGVEYPGHTEMFADWCGTQDYAMTFFSPKMNCALLSIHIPVKDISRMLTAEKLYRKLITLISTMRNDLGVEEPSIAVLGLNPHAGENGLIGSEEEKIVKPLLKDEKLKKYCSGPYSADAFFANKQYKNFDMVLGMYHDQVLIPFKLLNFDHGVNYTAGLPVVRTSPDHGTAFDIAWSNTASESSMLEAFRFAHKVVTNRKKNVPGAERNL